MSIYIPLPCAEFLESTDCLSPIVRLGPIDDLESALESSRLDAHHIQHWCEGGETSLDNLILLCIHHHRQMHEGGFRLRAAANGYYFTRPDGRPIEQRSPAENGGSSSAEDGPLASVG